MIRNVEVSRTPRGQALVYRRTRVPYARALYAAAIAALVCACTQIDSTSPANTACLNMSDVSSEIPEVVISASRIPADAIG